MAALFACTRCNGRHPFEDLSSGEQLCKECRNNFPVVKCTYCRAEFQQGEKGSTSSICKKCAANVKALGKPTACEYCNIIAAFIGNKCQRCANSEKKWGLPQTCEQCKQQCAFDRSEEARRKVDGKLLCWLCTMAYRRVLAKTKNRDGSLQNTPLSSSDNRNNTVLGSSHHGSSEKHSHHKKSYHRHGHHHSHHHKDGNKTKEKSHSHKSKGEHIAKEHKSHKGEKSILKSGSKEASRKEADSASAAKKPRLDKSTSNGMTLNPSKTTSDNSFLDLSSTDNMIAITQLREEVESLKKQLSQKDVQIIDRDKKITELKANHYEQEKNMRLKLQNLQKQHTEAIEQLQVKNRDLQKQISSLNKQTSRKDKDKDKDKNSEKKEEKEKEKQAAALSPL